jgi:UDP-N-acetylmuramate--alanine ligase
MLGVTSELILNAIEGTSKELVADADLIKVLASRPLEVLLTIGAGDIDKQVAKIKDYFTPENQAKA